MKTLTGLAELIEVNTEGRCGGAVARLARMPQAVSFLSISPKMMKRMTKMMELIRQGLKIQGVIVAKKMVTQPRTVIEILI